MGNKYRIIFKNHDIDDYWHIVGYVGEFDSWVEAKNRITSLYPEWPSQFKQLDIIQINEELWG